MARYRIDLPEHGEDAGIDVQFDGDHEMTPEEIEAFKELAALAFKRMDEERDEEVSR